MQKPYDRKKELICIIYCPNCKGAVAACKESSVNVTAEGDSNLYSPQSFNEQAAFFIKRDVGYKAGKVAEGVKITVCKCKKQRQ